MNWLTNPMPKIRSLIQRRKPPDNFWIKCPMTGELVPRREVEENLFVIPGSEYHMPIEPETRLKATFDGEWSRIDTPEVPDDPLKFRDKRRYADRLKDARKKTAHTDAVVLGYGTLGGIPVVIGVHDFRFVGGTLGVAAGESVIKGFETAIEKDAPLILFIASGGARLQEGVFSLMQMPRVTILVQDMREARLPFIVVLTNPTYGGVTASYGMLGDIAIAEPHALIGFAGRRVIEEVTGEKNFPPDFQRSEYLLSHGMIDMVVHRRDMRAMLARLCRLLTPPKTT